MKNTIKTLLAALLLLVSTSACLRAQSGPGSSPNSSPDPAVTSVSTVSVGVQNSPSARGRTVDIVAILSTFGMPVLIVAMALFFKFRRDRLAHETLRAMIEKGVPITPELLAQLKNKDPEELKPNNNSRHLLPGLICAGVGAALLIGNFNSNRSGTPGIPAFAGWIVLFVGVAFLIVWLVERNNKNDAQPPRS